MKITLEINTTNEQDIIDAINSLKTFVPKENFLIQEANIVADKHDIEEMKPKYIENKDKVNAGFDIDMIDDIDIASIKEVDNELDLKIKNMEDEISSLKETIKTLKEDKSNLKKEKESLLSKITNLETELTAIPSIPMQNEVSVNNESDILKEIEDYKRKNEELTKNVAFHETRSNKNFEEVKKLRGIIDGINFEKRNLEKNISSLQKEIEELKNNSNVVNEEDLAELKELKEKVASFENTKEKLMKDVEFHKNRSKVNWEELKVLKNDKESLEKENDNLRNKIEDLSINSDNLNNKEEVEKLKSEIVQIKAEYESIISELRLTNDKIQNEIDLYKTKYSDNVLKEYNHLKMIRDAICSHEKGASFWNNVEANIPNS